MMLTRIKIMLATLVVLVASYPLGGCDDNAGDTHNDGGQYGGQYLDPRADDDSSSGVGAQYEVTLERTSLPDTGGGTAAR